MPIHSQAVGNKTVISLQGQLILGKDVDEFRSAWSKVVADGAKEVVIDLTNVRRVDSSGIGSLIRCHSSITSKGGRIRLVGVNQTVRQVFQVTRLDRVFEFYESLEEALASPAGL